MGLTPDGGIPMSTRSGDLDPGVSVYLTRSENMTPGQFSEVVSKCSGLLGISETTADMKQLLEVAEHDARAKDAVDIFCYNVRKTIGAYAAALGGIDTLVISGGMGEKAPKIRAQICANLDFLGLRLDDERNLRGDAVISADDSRVMVRVIPTDEASVVAEEVTRVLSQS
jgi:acetate kinase